MSLNEVWEAASATPFHPIVSKDSQFAIGFNLLFVGMHSSCESVHTPTDFVYSSRDCQWSVWTE